ncbi:maleylpyruvate isomerase family mycothiol-dependent enzyme [uncultured Williamsia sp.]|uniref:maleylpyruvate isomerase family mycothiol-dependent enzyme n=1 Tax=uncultured Williamsia sp. TaxID=259311 RepID=UPI00262B288A|nr:maleylpyruvate isomerase family mycothiol-dependent enzyme [uncultured Williamsia sp.]
MTFDAVTEWTAAQQRVIGLVGAATSAAVESRVPACPDWTVRDLLSHMVGIGVDVVAGNEPDDHGAEWTAAQVDARRDRDVSELIAEWRGLTDAMVAHLRTVGDRPINDIVIHEQDLRGALRIRGATDTPAALHVRDRFAGRLGDRVAGLPTLALRGTSWNWRSAEGEATVVVAASDADLARALVSRRSAAQLRAWTVVGDVGPYLDAFAVLGELPTVDLAE